jgi:cytoskeletal protein CcmA (bactofilin family)
MKKRMSFLHNERGNVLVFVLVVLVVASLALPAFLKLSFESLRSTYRSQDEMQQFYAADLGVEDALFRLGDESFVVPMSYELEDVNGYDVNVCITKDEEGTYVVISTAIKDNEPDATVETEVSMYQLAVACGDYGSLSEPGEGTFIYPADTVVTLLAVPDYGYDFDNWTGDISSIANPNIAYTDITMEGDYAIQANFAAPPMGNYTLIISSTIGGAVTTPGEGSFEYTEGWEVDLVAISDTGFDFESWTGDTGTVANPNSDITTVIMLDDYTIVANFVEEFTLTITSSEGGHASTPGEGAFTYDPDTVVDLEAANYNGYDFDGWTGEITSVADPGSPTTTITMLADYTIQADFIEGLSCRPCFEYAIVSLSEDDPLVIENNGVTNGDVYGKAGVELNNGVILDGNAYSDGDLYIYNVSQVRGNALAQGNVVVNNNGKVDGNVYADGDIIVKNNGHVYGDAYATGEIIVRNNGIIDGDIYEYCSPGELLPMPTLDPPAPEDIEQLRSQYEGEADIGGHYYGDYVISRKTVEELGPLHIHGDLTIENRAEVTLQGTVYVDGDIEIENNCTISGSAGAIVGEGKIEIQNNSGLNPLAIPVIMSVYDDIVCKNNSIVGAALYAPSGEILLDNNSEIYGAVVGYEVTTKNNFAVTHAPELTGRDDLPECGCT